jgi:class 3 adenylate cyclase/predicted ATPase
MPKLQKRSLPDEAHDLQRCAYLSAARWQVGGQSDILEQVELPLRGAGDHRMDIEAWLQGLGLERYVLTFRDNEIDWEVLPKLTSEDLREIGVAAIGHRRKLLDAIAALGASAPIGPVTAAVSDASAPANAERRQLTVMFCDLVGSTELSARLDPEDLREVISAYHRTVAAIVAEFDGLVSRYMGDGVLIYFGYPQAHEDDAERAVRTGLSVIEAVGRHDVKSVRLQTRVGIATGLAVVGDLIGEGGALEQSAVGETPNLAARLQALAEPDMVVIAAATRRLVGDLFEYRDLGAVQLKGFAGKVQAYQVLRASAVESRFEALHSAPLTPLVGREEEIELLLRRWRRAKSGDGQVVLLCGEPGIGKSRIATVLEESLRTEPHTKSRYFCSPYYTESALHPTISQLEHAAGFDRDDSPPAKFDKLAALLARTAATTEEMALVAELLSLPVAEGAATRRLSPQQKKERTLAAVVRQLEALARQAPMLMLFEDAHWADPSSRALLDRVVEAAARLPMLLVITFRPEYSPPWIGSSHVAAVTLSRLGPREGAAMVEKISGNEALPAAIISEIVERTDGVPLFVEELTRAVLEAGGDEMSTRRMLSAVPGRSPAVPAALQASFLARLDWLGARAKQIAQIGAAIGREFSYELLAAVARRDETEIRTGVRRLLDAGLVLLRGTEPDGRYAFKHALLRDAAYSTLLRIQRQELHERIGQMLEERFPQTVGAQPEIVAHHYTEAGNNERAVDYWVLAGKRSAARCAIGEAVVQFERGLAQLQFMHETTERQQKELDLQCQLGSVRLAAYGYGAAQTGAAYDRARDLWWQLGSPPGFLHVPWGQWMYHINGGDLDAAQGFAEELFQLSQRQKDGRGVEVLGHLCVGVCQNLRGVFALCRPRLTEALHLYDRAERRALVIETGVHPPAIAFGHLGLALWCLGYPDQALATALAGINRSRSEKNQPSLATSLSLAMRALSFGGNDKLLAQIADELAMMGAELGFPYWRAQARIYHGWLAANAGDTERGLFDIHEGLAASGAAGARIWMPRHLALHAQARVLRGEFATAIALVHEALGKSGERGEYWYDGELHRLLGGLLLEMDKPEDAEAEFGRALTIARDQQAHMWELRTATSLARLWRDQGRWDKARDLLAPVYGWFTEGFDTPDLKQAKALLDELT